MKLGLCVITITSSILLTACHDTRLRFGNPDSPDTASMHNDLGMVYENSKMNVLAPMSENKPAEVTVLTPPVKVVQPKKLRSTANNIAQANIQAIMPQATTAAPVAPTIIPTPASIQNNWQPNEALLIRGSELLLGLQKELGVKPSQLEMQKRLQTHMGLSATQAQQLITTLGM